MQIARDGGWNSVPLVIIQYQGIDQPGMAINPAGGHLQMVA